MAEITQLLEEYRRIDPPNPGVAAVILHGDTPRYEAYIGYENLEHRVIINKQTAFYLASLSKTFTGAAVQIPRMQGV